MLPPWIPTGGARERGKKRAKIWIVARELVFNAGGNVDIQTGICGLGGWGWYLYSIEKRGQRFSKPVYRVQSRAGGVLFLFFFSFSSVAFGAGSSGLCVEAEGDGS